MYDPEASEQVKRTVSEMLTRVEKEGLDAVRHYSRELDRWEPDSFIVGQDEIDRAAEHSTTNCASTSRSPRSRSGRSRRPSARR